MRPAASADSIFLALASVAPADRDAWLDERCGADRALRDQVDRLVAALDDADERFLDPALIPTIAPPDGPLTPGTRLGGFLVLHALGSGGMGVVYAAQQERPLRTVAIKVLRRGYHEGELLRRFEREAELLARLQHPGIAQVYAFHQHDGATPAHLVMELVAGPPITEYARAHRLTIAERAALAVKVCDAVSHAHERGVIHRDLKPENLLVAGGGQPKVLDFGIARIAGADVHRVTMQTAHGQLMGTLAYMSPEQLRGAPSIDLDARSDVYALGVLFYQLFTGHLPFAVAGVPWVEAMRLILDSDPLPLPSTDPRLNGALTAIIGRAMSRDRDSRYQSAGDLAADLREYLAGRGPSLAAAGLPSEPPAASDSSQPLAVITGRDLIVTTRSGEVVCGLPEGQAAVLREDGTVIRQPFP